AEHYPVFARLGNARWAELVARPHFPVTEQGDGPQTAPAVDGSTVPEVPDAVAEWWLSPRWYLEGWNVGAQVSGQQLDNPDEGGAARGPFMLSQTPPAACPVSSLTLRA